MVGHLPARARPGRGFGWVELFAVLAILGALHAFRPLGAREIGRVPHRWSEREAESHLDTLARAIGAYRADTKHLPQSLTVLIQQGPRHRAPYLPEIPDDPWGNPYLYRSGYELSSSGPDGRPHTDDDIVWSGPR